MSIINKPDNLPYLIAEIGGNHEGCFDKAVKLTHLACKSGVDSVKFQIYTGSSLVNEKVSPERKKHFDRFALSENQYIKLFDICDSYGVHPSASIWKMDTSPELFERSPYIKIGSGDFNCWPVIEQQAKAGNKPLLISTGLSTDEDVFKIYKKARNLSPFYKDRSNLCFLQCTAMYPIPDTDANLRVIQNYKQNLDVTVGYSDHTIGTRALVAAYTLGASVLEFHYTDDKTREFRDHKVSLDNDDINKLKSEIKAISNLLGSSEKTPTKSELDNNHIYSFRRGTYASKDLRAGHILTLQDLEFLRPAEGINPLNLDSILGKQLTKPIKQHEAISLSSVKADS